MYCVKKKAIKLHLLVLTTKLTANPTVSSGNECGKIIFEIFPRTKYNTQPTLGESTDYLLHHTIIQVYVYNMYLQKRAIIFK